MTTGYLQPWGAPPERLPGITQINVAGKEFARRPVLWAALFAFIAFAVLALGILTPPTYTSSSTLLVENSNIIAAEDGPVTSTASNHAVVAREVAFSRRVMQQILAAGGWTRDNPSAIEQERLIGEIVGRTDIQVSDRSRSPNSTTGVNVIKVSYSDADPQRAYLVTKRFAELLISESLARKHDESREAYRFLDSQVAAFQRKLAESGEKLQRYRRDNPDAHPDLDGGVTTRIAELRRAVDNARMELADSASQEGQMQSLLSRESELGGGLSRGGQFRSRMAELQAEKSRLSLQYTDRHPDVVRIQNQINDLAKGSNSDVAPTALAGAVNPMYGELRIRLADARRVRAAAASRIAAGQALLNAELERSRNSLTTESTLGALVRDHEINRELYQDLVKRRETARVSVNLDAAGRGLNYRIQEQAAVPLLKSGLRLMHFALAGLALAVVIPLLLMAALVKHDPRARTALQIERGAGLPVLGTIPVHHNHKQRAAAARRHSVAAALLVAVPIVYGLVLVAKMVQGT